MVAGGSAGRLSWTREDALYKGRGVGGPVGLGELGWRGSIRGSWGMHRRTPSQSAASAFLPSRGADPAEALLAGRGGGGAEIRGRPPFPPLPLRPYTTLEL